ncbi:Error-prone DNA polymerase [Streptomyces hirsutus]
MSKTPFTHLHVHTQYSLLDGAARLKDMFNACNEMGMSHIAMSDHGNLHGAYDFFHSAQKAGVTPIIGIEAYVAPESRRTKRKIQWGQPHQKRDDVSGSGGYTHKTIWAVDSTGLHNLFKLSSDAYAEGWLQKWPRMDKETISKWSTGLVASTGCPSGEVQTRLRLGHFDEALKAAADYQDIFGKDRYFLELMDHGIEIERRVRDGLLEIGKKLGIPPLVTNDSHYTYAHEATAHDALLCIQTGKNLSDPDRFRFDGTGYYLKSTDEMYAIDSSDAWQQGCANTRLIADMVDTTGMLEKRDLMPKFDIPEGYTEVSWFREETMRGMHRRFPGGIPDDRMKQVEYEMDTIISMGFPGYFLVVADFTDDEWDKTYLLAQEREMLGLYVSDHPLFGLEHVLSDKADAGISQLTGGDFGDGAVVTIGGIISGLQRKMTKQGNAWAIATVEDLAGSIECMFFPATYQSVSTQLVEDAVVFVKGRLDKREDVPRLVAMELQVPDLSNAGTNAPVVLTIPATRVTPPMVSRLGEILGHHKGDSEVRIKLQGPTKTTVLRLDRHRVKPDPALFGDLKVLLGPSCLAG